MKIEWGKLFQKVYFRLPSKDQDKIDDFVEHLEKHGFEGLPGRNKNSDNVDKNSHKFMAIAQYAHQHKLWHYHIGIPHYITRLGRGDYVSEFVLHYQRLDDDTVKLVRLDNHKPFALPTEEFFEHKQSL